jgi:sulfate transport system ATP-binding protein
MSIQIRHVSKRFGHFRALNDLSLEIETGELIALLGPSGCGKTTLLRIIAGLDTPDTGNVLVQGEDTTGLAVQKRNIGFVFQHYALFRHMTVFDNVAFGLRVRPRSERPPAKEVRERVNRLLALVQIDWMSDRYPDQLSGGQRQRVALARALAVEPRVLLLDEPFGALDAKVRKDLRRWLRRLHDELSVTSVFVTHDQEEALEVADRVVVVNAGRVEQIGSPDEVYAHPASAFVYSFLGAANRFDGHVSGRAFHAAGLRHPMSGMAPEEGSRAIAFARPHDLEVEHPIPGAAGLSAQLLRRYSRGGNVVLELEYDGADDPIEVEMKREEAARMQLEPGQTLLVRPSSLRVFRQ